MEEKFKLLAVCFDLNSAGCKLLDLPCIEQKVASPDRVLAKVVLFDVDNTGGLTWLCLFKEPRKRQKCKANLGLLHRFQTCINRKA